MALKKLYQSREKSKSGTEQQYKVVWYGKETEVDALIATLTIGTSEAEGCYLQRWHKTQNGADIWQVELEYTQSFEWGSYSNVPPTVVGQKSAQLSVKNLQLPLENLENYLWNWNYYLIQKADSKENTSLPSWWESLGKDSQGYLQEIPDADADDYKWVHSMSEKPDGPDEQGNRWYFVAMPTKPGVDYYDWATFVVTESAKYRSASSAGSAINKNINHIIAPSNTFGLNWGNWKLSEANVSYDGKAWIGTCVYEHSGDELGWDESLYGN